ncbi:MAG TPA: NDP-sugar synthase [Candidatus Binataceae bacterium]
MRALVLAAGKGERLRPLTETVPKPMLDAGGRPLIHYPLMMLRRAGITEVAINAHHLAGQLQGALGDGAALGIRITWAPEPVLFGTGGPLNALREFFGREPFVIANGDTILDLDLAAMLAFHRERSALATIALCHPANLEDYSRLEIDSVARIRRMRLLKRRTPLEYTDYPANLDERTSAALQGYMYCGAIVAEPAVLDQIPKPPPWSLMEGLFAPMVARGMPVIGWVHRGLFRTVDDLKSYAALQAEFAASPPRFEFLA